MSELNLYQVEMECRGKNDDIEIRPYLTDLSDPGTTCRVFEDFINSDK
jgi:FlaA1/EpsC-like NDP-sugar epimerase